MKNKGWIIFQIAQFIIFFGVGIFLVVRTVDGSGAEQTLQAKLISVAVWGLFYLGLFVMEWVICFIVYFVRRGKQ